MPPLGSIVSSEVVSIERGEGGKIIYQVKLQSDVCEGRVENVGTITVNENLLELEFVDDDEEEETENATT